MLETAGPGRRCAGEDHQAGVGDTVTSGELIAQIITEAKAAEGAAAAVGRSPAAAAPAAAAASGRPPAPPARPRKILDEKGIAAGDVAGSGRGGRVTNGEGAAPPSRPKPPPPAGRRPAVRSPAPTEERVPMTRLRARIAERLIQSKNENAILTTFNEVNMRR